MTALEIYLVVAPITLLTVAAAITYWWLHRPNETDKRTRQSPTK